MTRARVSAVASRHGRREARKRVTRQELLAAARQLFGERGLYDARIEDLAQLAGVAKGTVYGYFESKEALIEAVVASGYNELLGLVHRQVRGVRNHPEVVTRIAEAHLSFFEENPDLMRVFHQVRGLLKYKRPAWRPLRRALEDYLAGLAHILALHHQAGPATHRHRLELATLLFGAVSGITSTRASVSGLPPRGRFARGTARALVALVRAYQAPAPASRRRATD